jgi:uncharacterized protein
MALPTIHQIEALHKKYAPTPAVLELVWTHCRIVNDIAQQAISFHHLEVDPELVRVGCLLHDIGVYRVDLHYITHGVRGEAILKDEGYPETISRFASHHTGVGLTARDITSHKLPLPALDFLAETVEEELVMYADKFHSKDDPPCFNTYDWYLRYAARFGSDKASKFEDLAGKFGLPDLAPLIEKYGHTVRR